jgi:hypothetical protein
MLVKFKVKLRKTNSQNIVHGKENGIATSRAYVIRATITLQLVTTRRCPPLNQAQQRAARSRAASFPTLNFGMVSKVDSC